MDIPSTNFVAMAQGQASPLHRFRGEITGVGIAFPQAGG